MSKLSKKFSGEVKTVAKNYGALVVLQGLNYLLPLLIIPFLERQLGLEKFGLVVWFFQGIEKMRLITIINVIAKVIFTILLLLFITSPDDFLNVPIFNSIGFITAGIISFIISLKYVSWHWPDFKGTKEFYKESFQVFSSNVASQIAVAANGLILGFFVGDAIVGVYSAFEKLILAAKNMYIPIYQSIYPYMSRKNWSQKKNMMRLLIPSITLLGIIGYGVIYFLGDFIIDLLYKDERIINNVYLFKILGLIVVFSGLNMLYLSLFAPASKLYTNRLTVLVVGAVTTLVLNFTFVPSYGINATIYSFTFVEGLMLLFCMYLYLKKTPKQTLLNE